MKILHYIGLASLLGCVILMPGCGKEVIPDPPLTQNKLIIELFKNLAAKEHEMALNKIIKLRAVEPENQFLPQMEEFEVANLFTISIQKELDDGNIDEALQLADAARRRYGLYRNLIAMEEELKKLKSLQDSVDRLAGAESSDQLKIEIEEIKKLCESYKPAQKLAPLLVRQTKAANEMADRENRRAKFSLLADLTSARKENHQVAAIMAAQLTLENMLPENKNSRVRENLLSSK